MLTLSALEPTRQCAQCGGGFVYDSESGEQLCRKCGVVSTTVYQDSPTPSGLPHSRSKPESNLMYDIHLPTLIGSDNVDANGKSIRHSHEFDQLRRLNRISISRDSETNNGMKAIAEINRITEAMSLPVSVSNEAQEVYRRGLKEGVIKGKSIVNMAAATVLIAAATVGVSCSLDEMERMVTSVRGRMARKYYRLLIRTMNLEPAQANPSLHVSRIAGRAGLSVTVQRRALEILETVRASQSLGDKRSLSVAGAALYLASIETGERINQLRLAYAVGTTPITIRKRSSDIAAVLASARSAKALLDELRLDETKSGLEEDIPAQPSAVTVDVLAIV